MTGVGSGQCAYHVTLPSGSEPFPPAASNGWLNTGLPPRPRMRRRAVLQLGIGLAGIGAAGLVGATRSAVGAHTRRRSGGYEPLGRVSLPGARDCRVAPGGETAYVAVGDGFASVAVPSMEPLAAVRSIEADRDGGPLSGIADVSVDGDRLLVPGPANPRPDRTAGFAMFDVTDPAAPEQVAFHGTSFPIHNAELEAGRAYFTAGRSLVVVDVTDDEPVEVGRWSPADVDPRWDDVPLALWNLHDVRVRGDLAVLSHWDAGTWLVDVADPSAVTVVGRAGGRTADELASVGEDDVRTAAVQLPGNHHSAALTADGSLLAVGAEAFDATAGDDEGGPGGIDLYDVTDPAAPVHLATIDAPRAADETHAGTWTTAHDFAFDGDRLLSAWYQGGVRVHDVSTPGSPAELAWWRRPREAAFWTARPAAGDTFVASATRLPDDDLVAGLYRFPNRAGVQADPPSLTDPSTPTRTPTASPTDSPTATATPGQPGFGPVGAFAGLAGLAAWRRWRRQR